MAGNKWICYSIGDEDLHGRRQGCAEHVVVHSRLRRLWRHDLSPSHPPPPPPGDELVPLLDLPDSATAPPPLSWGITLVPCTKIPARYLGYQVSSISRYQGTRYWYLPIPGYRYQGETKHGLKEVDLAWMLGELKSPYPTEGVDLA
uniref:Uncharacterized protein n=1 Tax=Oryza rufipogon TaxID=4529 RepID=A0A0E0PCG1_ORYRU